MKTQYGIDGADQSAADGYSAAAPADVTGADDASALAASNPYRTYQWYLDGDAKGASNGAGANVDAISIEYTGQGVVVGIIDEGFDTTNPDLAGRFDLSLSYDPRDHGAINIMPDSSAAVHGTWVAGVLGASADNDYGIVGVAPDATLAGFYARFGVGGSSRAELADLLARQVNVDVSNNSWGYTTQFGDNFQNPAWSAVSSALQTDATQGREGLGTVLVFAAGNGRQYIAGSSTYDDDNTNDHNLTNSRFVITAAASTEDGHIAPYSTPGASILVTAPGDSILTTADNNNDGNPNNDFAYVSGTSFAAPIVSGVVAMMLEANPDLGYRDVQEILALSSEKIDPTSPSWSTNGATNWNGGANLVSNDFGFGLIDAHAAVRLAETWTTTHTAANEQEISLAGDVGGNGALVDFHPNDYTVTVPASDQDFSIDWVTVDVSLQHSHIGDLKIDLISPTGTDSVLMDMPGDGTDSQANLSFTFSTDHDWGESPVGTWTLVVEDAGTGGTGSLLSYAIHIYGDNQGPDTTYYYTDDFATLAGDRGTIDDPSGLDTINAAAVTSDLKLDLHAGATSTIAGHTVTISPETTIVTAYGGDGNDTIIGNDAGDHLYGGHGNDTLVGGHGDDTLDGGAGADTMAGGAGNDTYYVDNPGDVVTEHANEGIDTVVSGISHTLEANVENLTLTGSDNIDGTGNDLDNIIVSNTGVDTLTGGDGNDTYYVHNSLDHVIETPTGGNDTVYADVDFTLPANVETLVLVSSGDAHVVADALDTIHALDVDTSGGADNIDGVGNDLDNTLIGTAGDNVLDGGHGADTMIGGAGHDTYMVDNPGDTIVEYANEGTDTVFTHVDYTLSANVENLVLSGPGSLSGTGNDLTNLIVANDAGDTINGGGGGDGLIGGAGIDHISGGDGADWIYGLGGNDVLDGGAGNDVIFGGDGNDTITGGDGDDFLSGDAGNDQIDGGNGDNFMFGGDGDDHITGGDGNDAIAAGAGNDTVDGGDGINWIDGGDGNDVLRGGDGLNALFGGHGDDTLIGGNGMNGLDGGAGNDVLIGGTGRDWLYGGDGNDILVGGKGNDVLVGGAGADRLIGGPGADFLAGGAGADTFVFNAPADGGDVVTDFTRGVDTIEIDAAGFGLPASGTLPDAMFAQGGSLPADFASDTPIFYADQTLHALWFDPTGGSSSDAVLVAGFLGALPTASDFHLV